MKLPSPSDLLKSTFILILGTGLGQAIPVLLQPVLRRIYSPEDFGAFAIYFSMFSILTVITNFRYDIAIGLPRSDRDGANLLFLTIIINFILNLLIFAVLLIFKDGIASHLSFPARLADLLYILPLSMFCFSVYQSINYWLIRKKAFRSISVNKISRRGAEGLVQTGTGLLRMPSGLFWGDLAGNFINAVSGLWQLKKTGLRRSWFSIRSAGELFRQYAHFPRFNLLPHLLGTIAMQYPVFIINRNYTKTDLGFFDLTQQALILPFALITVAVSQVLLKKVTENRHEEKPVRHDFFLVSAVLAGIGIFCLVIIEFFGPVLFSFVFGSKWVMAGVYSRTLIFRYLFFLIASPMNAVLIGLEKVKTLGIWNITHFLLMIILGSIKGIPLQTFFKLLALFQVISYSIFYLLTLNAVLKFDSRLKKQ